MTSGWLHRKEEVKLNSQIKEVWNIFRTSTQIIKTQFYKKELVQYKIHEVVTGSHKIRTC